MSLAESYACIFTAMAVVAILLLGPIAWVMLTRGTRPEDTGDRWFIITNEPQAEEDPEEDKEVK